MSPVEFFNWLSLVDRRPLVMGVLNVTPDSFSDGGKFAEVDAAVAHARQMIDEGADLIDIGGESTRPGAARVPADEQLRRVLPVIEGINELPIAVSIDTTLASVAAAALDAGACIINDISAGTDDPAMVSLAASRGCPIVLMHMQGTPSTMQDRPHYDNVVSEVASHLKSRVECFANAGVQRENIILDPGIGFGKAIEHNLSLLRHLSTLTGSGFAVLVGVSRKGFLGRIAGIQSPSDRVWPTAAAVAWCVSAGAAIVRVHDVAPMVQVVRTIRAISHGAQD